MYNTVVRRSFCNYTVCRFDQASQTNYCACWDKFVTVEMIFDFLKADIYSKNTCVSSWDWTGIWCSCIECCFIFSCGCTLYKCYWPLTCIPVAPLGVFVTGKQVQVHTQRQKTEDDSHQPATVRRCPPWQSSSTADCRQQIPNRSRSLPAAAAPLCSATAAHVTAAFPEHPFTWIQCSHIQQVINNSMAQSKTSPNPSAKSSFLSGTPEIFFMLLLWVCPSHLFLFLTLSLHSIQSRLQVQTLLPHLLLHNVLLH